MLCQLLGDMASIQELEQQVQLMKKRSLEISAEIRNANKRAKRASGVCNVAQVLHKAGVDGVKPILAKKTVMQLLVLVELAGGPSEWDVVVSYVLGQGRQEKCGQHGFDMWNPEVRRNITAGLQLLYLKVDFSILVASLDDSAKEVMALSKYLVEHRLWWWLVNLNCKKGVKPSTPMLLSKACSFISEKANSEVLENLRGFFLNTEHGGRSALRWVASFKDRWKADLGLLQVGETMELEELRAKVPWHILSQRVPLEKHLPGVPAGFAWACCGHRCTHQ